MYSGDPKRNSPLSISGREVLQQKLAPVTAGKGTLDAWHELELLKLEEGGWGSMLARGDSSDATARAEAASPVSTFSTLPVECPSARHHTLMWSMQVWI